MKVLVLGFGPAGSSVAIASPNDIEIYLYDVLERPRSFCAGGLTIWDIREIEGYGPQFKKAIDKATMTYAKEAEILGKSKKARIYINAKDHNLKSLGVIINRRIFDLVLLKEALKRNNVEVLKTRLDQRKYDVVVDARGMSSLPKLPDDDIELVAQAYVDVGYLEPKLAITFWKDLSKTGYFWEFPEVKSGILKVGFGMSLKEFRKRRVDMRKILEKYMVRRGISGKIVEYKVGRLPLTKPKLEYLYQGMFKVGTSACLVDPLTGAGIRYAIRSGFMLARSGFRKDRYLNDMKETVELFGKRYRIKKILWQMPQSLVDKSLEALEKQFNILIDKIDPAEFPQSWLLKNFY